MTSNTKLILSFSIVILFMVGGMVAYVFYWQEQEGQEAASHKVSNALSRLNSDFARMQTANRDFANKLCANQSLVESAAKQDRSALASLIKIAIDARNFAGSVTIFDQYGRVIYSSDTPGKFGYSERGKNGGVDYVLTSLDSFTGPTVDLSPTQSISLTAMVPILGEAGRCAGIVAVSEPIDEEFLTGEAMKFALLAEPLDDVDFVLLGVKDRNQIYLTPGLVKDKLPYLRELGEHGVTALPSWREPGGSIWQVSNILNWANDFFKKNTGASFIKDRHFWQSLNLVATGARSSGRSYTADNATNGVETIAVILATTAIHAEGIKPGFIMIIICILGMCAFILSLILSARITDFERPLQALMERVKTWQTTKTLPPPSGLAGGGLEMAQLIDQTFLNWQDELHALRAHVHKITMEAGEKAETEQGTGDQLANVNRQLANQSRQLSEFSSQLNYANQQAVFLQQELQAILQSTTEGFLILDRYGNVISANNIFLNWLGMSEGEIAGRFCFDLVQKPGEKENERQSSQSQRSFVKHESDASALIDQYFPEGIIYNSNFGPTVEVLLHLQPVAGHDSNIQGYILVVRDKSLRSEIAGLRTEIVNMLARAIRGPLISAEKEWQQILTNYMQIFKKTADGQSNSQPQITNSKDTPPDQIFNIQQEWNQELNQELSDASKRKSPEFINWQMLLDLHSRYQNLIRSVESMLAAHGQSVEQYSSAAPEGQQLVEGLDGIFPTAEAAKVESFPVSRLVGDCLEEVANLARERQLMLDHKISTALPNLTGNRALIKSILIPVVDKMISVTNPSGKVRVESSLKDKEIQLSVSSSGPALPEEEIVDMFAGFIPGKHSEDSYGSRLSLYLARNNAERIGAHIWAQSEASRGTTVYVTFPAA